jgi:hypothetical protein
LDQLPTSGCHDCVYEFNAKFEEIPRDHNPTMSVAEVRKLLICMFDSMDDEEKKE